MYEYEKTLLKNLISESYYNIFKEHKVILAGGTIKNIFTKVIPEANDLDIFPSKETNIKSLIQSVHVDSSYITKKAILYPPIKKYKIPIQIIYSNVIDNIQELWDTFDFTVCMGAFDFRTEEFVLHDSFLKDNCKKRLVVNPGTKFPIISMLRVDKYKEYGYSIDKKELLKLSMAINFLKVESFSDLQDHCSGLYGYDLEIESKDLEFNTTNVYKTINDLLFSKSLLNDNTPKFQYNDLTNIYIKLGFTKVYLCTNENKFYQFYDNKIRFITEAEFNTLKEKHKVITPEEVAEAINPNKFLYKNVLKKDNKYYSFYKQSFEYKIGETITPESNDYLYFYTKNKVAGGQYNNTQNGVVLECLVDENITFDMIANQDMIKIKKCIPIREIKIDYDWEDNLPF